MRVPLDKRSDGFQYNILDQTRIHYRHYEYVYKIVTDCIYHDQPNVNVDNHKK